MKAKIIVDGTGKLISYRLEQSGDDAAERGDIFPMDAQHAHVIDLTEEEARLLQHDPHTVFREAKFVMQSGSPKLHVIKR